MFGIGMPELIIILIIILIIFGAGKLSEIGSGLGKGISNFKRAIHDKPEEISYKDKEEDKKEDKNAEKKND